MATTINTGLDAIGVEETRRTAAARTATVAAARGGMPIREILRVSLEALRVNKMRSLLTMLGIIIGVSAVIAMQALGNGAKEAVNARIASLGTTLVTINAGPGLHRRHRLRHRPRAPASRGRDRAGRAGARLRRGAAGDGTPAAGAAPQHEQQRQRHRHVGQLPGRAQVHARGRRDVRRGRGRGPQARRRARARRPPRTSASRRRTRPSASRSASAARSSTSSACSRRRAARTASTTPTIRSSSRSARRASACSAATTCARSTSSPRARTRSTRRWPRRSACCAASTGSSPGRPDDFQIRNQADFLNTAAETTQVFTYLLLGVATVIAARRRHRHHEHHAGVGHGAHARGRRAQGARRDARDDPLAVPDRGRGALRRSAASSASCSARAWRSGCGSRWAGRRRCRRRRSSSRSRSRPSSGWCSACGRRGARRRSIRSSRCGTSEGCTARGMTIRAMRRPV